MLFNQLAQIYTVKKTFGTYNDNLGYVYCVYVMQYPDRSTGEQ